LKLDTLWFAVPLLLFAALLISSFQFRWEFSYCLIFFLANTTISLLLLTPILAVPFTGEFLFGYEILPREATWSYLFLDSTAWSNFVDRVSRHSYAGSVFSILFTFPLLLWFIEVIIGTRVTSRLLSIPYAKGLAFYFSVYLWIAVGLAILRVGGLYLGA